MIRRPIPADQAFIASTWIRSMAGREHAGPNGGDLGASVDLLLDRPDSEALVFVEGERIHGWVVYCAGRIPAVHYLYVRDRHRKNGIGSELLRRVGEGALVFTAQGPGAAIVQRMRPTAVYVPLDEWLS